MNIQSCFCQKRLHVVIVRLKSQLLFSSQEFLGSSSSECSEELENIPSKLAWGTFCAKMPSNLLSFFLHNDLLLFGQVAAAHLIQRSHTTQKHF